MGHVLVKGCTMDGPDHDMLHIYVSAMFPRVNKFGSEKEPTLLATTLTEIEALTRMYPRYFK